MALGLNKILVTGTYANTAAAYYQAVSNITVTTAGNVVPAGTYMAFNTANVVIQAVSNYNATSNVTTFSNVYPVNSGGVIISDGINVQFLATTNTSVQLITVNGGQAVSSTFAS
mgnify:FL=1